MLGFPLNPREIKLLAEGTTATKVRCKERRENAAADFVMRVAGFTAFSTTFLFRGHSTRNRQTSA